VRFGVVRGHFYVLEVRGRTIGKMISLPVDPLDCNGARYLVCPRGDSNWVRNARSAGETQGHYISFASVAALGRLIGSTGTKTGGASPAIPPR
jgi:hypothetical protein